MRSCSLAGNIGFISPGVGWAWPDRQVTADAFFGWVPASLGGDIYSVTAKVTWRPWAVDPYRDVELRPITGALQLAYTFGSRYFVVQPSQFPDDYYPFPTALRSALAFGSALSWRTWNGARLGVYYESWRSISCFTRGQEYVVSLTEVFSLAMGSSVEF